MVPVLIDLLSNTNYDIRSRALDELTKLGDQRAIEPILKLLRTDLTEKAVRALAKFRNPAVIDPLINAMKRIHLSLLPVIVLALNELGDPRWKQWIKGDYSDCLRLLDSDDPQAVELGKILQGPFTRELIAKLKSTYFDDRKNAAEILIRFAADPLSDLISQWQEVRRLITEPHKDNWEDFGGSHDCTERYDDTGIGLNFPDRPK